jgi:hypothetical protein
MFGCTTVLYKYMKLLMNDVNNLFDKSHVWIKIYQEFYYSIIYILFSQWRMSWFIKQQNSAKINWKQIVILHVYVLLIYHIHVFKFLKFTSFDIHLYDVDSIYILLPFIKWNRYLSPIKLCVWILLMKRWTR